MTSENETRALERLARARSRMVMIATPVARTPCLDYTIALAETGVHLARTGIQYCLQFVIGSSNLPRARNELCARFLASPCTDLLFVDDDMGWDPTAVVRLLASSQPVIGAVGRKRVDKPNTDPDVWCAKFPEGSENGLVQDDMGAIEVEALGTAFLKIERQALETLANLHPDWKRAGHDGMSGAVRDKYFQFFRFDEGQLELGEDFVFCERWRAAGGRIWIDPEIWLSHTGSKAWSGRISELMKAEGPR